MLVRTLLTGMVRTDAAALVGAAVVEFADLAEEPVGVGLRTQLARAQFMTERRPEAIVTADAVLPIAERLDLIAEIADLLVTKGSALNAVGRPREGSGMVETGRQLAEADGQDLTVLRATFNGMAPSWEDDPRAVMSRAVRGHELAVRLGRQDFDVKFREGVAYMALRTGDWEAAETLANDGLDLVPERDRPVLDGALGNFAVLRGADPDPIVERIDAETADNLDPDILLHPWWVRMLAGLATGRRDEVDAALCWMASRLPEALRDSLPHLVSSRLHLWAGEERAAAADLTRMRAIPWRGRMLDANAAALGAGITALQGRPDEALNAYRGALRLLKDVGARFDAALVAIDMATLLDPAHQEVRAAASDARELLGRLGAQPFLDRL
ncbi:MAG TPA: hypothetical protein VIH37_13840, partial [Candidatus Limnocylindrales bacterium]